MRLFYHNYVIITSKGDTENSDSYAIKKHINDNYIHNDHSDLFHPVKSEVFLVWTCIHNYFRLDQFFKEEEREKENQIFTFPAPTGPTTANNGFSYKNNHSKLSIIMYSIKQ